MFDLINVRSNHAQLNYSGQESKSSLQYMILTYPWLWNKVKVKVIKPGMNCYTRSKVIITQSLKDLAYTVSAKKPMKFLSNRKTCQLSNHICEKVVYPLSSWLSFHWTRTQNFHLKLFDIAVTLKYGQSLKVVWTGKAQWVVPSCPKKKSMHTH